MCGICFACSLSADEGGFSCLEKQESVDRCREQKDLADFDANTRSTIKNSKNLFRDSLLHHRGPDVCAQHVINITEGLHGHMQGCVLHLRGHITPQPVIDSAGNALMWNGEIFSGITVQEDENDTQVLFNMLVRKTSEKEILKTMQKIQGPWAFMYWQATAKRLWFGRDMFGRRSLLWHLPSEGDNHFILSSVALGNMSYTEVPSVGIFCMDFSTMVTEKSCIPSLTLHSWRDCRWPGTTQTVIDTKTCDIFNYLYPCQTPVLPLTISTHNYLDSWIPEINSYLPEGTTLISSMEQKTDTDIDLSDSITQFLESRQDLDSLAEDLTQILQEAVRKRVYNLPRVVIHKREIHCDDEVPAAISSKGCNDEQSCDVAEINHSTAQLTLSSDEKTTVLSSNVAVLFSGGLDSTVLAALADRCVPPDESIDLLNVAFEQPVVQNVDSKKVKSKPRKTQGKKNKGGTEALLQPGETFVCLCCREKMNAKTEERNLDTTNSRPTTGSANECGQASGHITTDCSQETLHCSSQKVGAFSGDVRIVSTWPQVCIHCTAHSKTGGTDETRQQILDPYDVPDRQTGRLAVSELNPNRKWNFVEINVTQAELQLQRESHIRKLIYPLNTVLDDSIGCAMWFASRGLGVLANDRGQPCISKARVILCGMAADEQFAGYSRHRVTFKTKGWSGLLAEIQEEMWRISARNLGRDDRIITDHGKESRFPFLDETFTEFVSKIPLHQRADLELPRGIGEKLLLRLSALKLGLRQTALQPKRAIQFGSKIAKLDKRKEKGSDVCERLT